MFAIDRYFSNCYCRSISPPRARHALSNTKTLIDRIVLDAAGTPPPPKPPLTSKPRRSVAACMPSPESTIGGPSPPAHHLITAGAYRFPSTTGSLPRKQSRRPAAAGFEATPAEPTRPGYANDHSQAFDLALPFQAIVQNPVFPVLKAA